MAAKNKFGLAVSVFAGCLVSIAVILERSIAAATASAPRDGAILPKQAHPRHWMLGSRLDARLRQPVDAFGRCCGRNLVPMLFLSRCAHGMELLQAGAAWWIYVDGAITGISANDGLTASVSRVSFSIGGQRPSVSGRRNGRIRNANSLHGKNPAIINLSC